MALELLTTDANSLTVVDSLPQQTRKQTNPGAGRPVGPMVLFVKDSIIENPANHKKWVLLGKAEKQNSVQSAAQNLRSHFGLSPKMTGFQVKTRQINADGEPLEYGLFVNMDPSLIEEGFVYVPRKRGEKSETPTPAEVKSAEGKSDAVSPSTQPGMSSDSTPNPAKDPVKATAPAAKAAPAKANPAPAKAQSA